MENDGLMMIQGDDGVFHDYNDEYDVTFHFESAKERDDFIAGCAWKDVDLELPPTGEYVLLSFSNFSIPAVGRYEEDEDGGGAFYLGDDTEVTLASMDMFVNAWRLLPKCMEG